MTNKKKLQNLKIAAVAAIVLMLAATLLAAFFESFASVAVTIAVICAIGLIILLRGTLKQINKLIDDIYLVLEKCPGYAVVRFNKKDEVADVSPNFQMITGLESKILIDDVDYRKLMCELISSPSDAGPDIYMSSRPESWVRLQTFETEDCEFTLVHDVSEYVSCRNIIKSLKYYDSETGMLCRDAFIAKVRSVAENNRGSIGMISLLISGVDRISSFKGASAADKVITKAAAFVKRFENPHNAFAGRTSTNEICLLLTDTYEDGCRKYADKLYYGLTEALGQLDNSEYIHVYCGYVLFDKEETDAGNMMSAADYAAYEAKTSTASAPIRFDRANYIVRAFDFKKIQVFNTIIHENRLDYHFQPVVDSHTGEIFGYEALMRPHEIDGIRLQPLEAIKIAKDQNMCERIEGLTMRNLFKYLAENPDKFNGKKLFINTIPNCFISDEEFETLFSEYGGLFEKMIIEITEGSQISAESIEIMRRRYSSRRALFALDDYGTGYANDSTLLSIQPDFIKLDRSLISGIDTDIQKRHLVTNMLNFAKNHGIKVLSEGVETKGELETVISLGVDYIQGYYTGKPSPVIMDGVATEIKDEILGINLKNVGYKRKFYTVENADSVDITSLAVNGFTDVTIASETVNLTSVSGRSVSMCLHCEDGYKGTVNIKDVNIFGLEAPVLTLGKNCDVTLNISGESIFGYEGIRVPETSLFTLTGDGRLKLDVSSDDGVVIGGNYLQDFGRIVLNHTGKLEIVADTSNVIALGGGIGGESSSVEIESGTLSTELRGINIIGAGAQSGQVRIAFNGGDIALDAAGRYVVGAGSFNGTANIFCSSEKLRIVNSGDKCCGIGTHENGSASLTFESGFYTINVNSKYATAIGAVDGNSRIAVNGGEYIINCEGNDAVGIGDSAGMGSVTINSGKFKIRTAASAELGIGVEKGKAVIASGNIIYDGRGAIRAISPNGDALRLDQPPVKSYSKTITSNRGEYTYTAEAFDGEAAVQVYIPAGM